MNTHIRRFFSGTLLSRVTGMLRDLAMAFAFGDHPSVASFFVAFRFANLFRRLLGEGPFQSALIPQLEEMRLKGPEKASFFFQRLTTLSSFFLIFIIFTSEVILKLICTYTDISKGNIEIIQLTMWMLPGLLFICLYGINLSLLHCQNVFFTPSVAPAICNSIWILGVFFLRKTTPLEAMISLSKLVTIGFFTQWLITLIPSIRTCRFEIKDFFSFHIPIEVKQLMLSFSLGAIAVGAEQINACIDAICARYAAAEGPIYLWYAIRLEQLALALFGIACVSTMVPKISRAIKAKNKNEAENLLFFAKSKTLLTTIPATFAIWILAIPGINLLYGRGNFSEQAVLQTAYCLFAYSFSLIPSTMIMLISAVFFAEKNFKTPMKITISSVCLNITLNFFCVFYLHLGAISTAITTSISAWVQWYILQKNIQKLGWQFKKSPLLYPVFVGLICTLVAFFSSYLFSRPLLSRSLYDQLLNFFSSFLGFFICIGVFFLRGSGNVDNLVFSQDKNDRS